MRGRAYPLKRYEPPAPPVARDERCAVNLLALVSSEGSSGLAHVVDLCERGFGARSSLPVPIGGEVVVVLPAIGLVRAQVRWALGGVFGARFVKPLDPWQLHACLARGRLAEPGAANG